MGADKIRLLVKLNDCFFLYLYLLRPLHSPPPPPPHSSVFYFYFNFYHQSSCCTSIHCVSNGKQCFFPDETHPVMYKNSLVYFIFGIRKLKALYLAFIPNQIN
uniref:Uncharacterized protein n=1 Tax=Cacopsylla melanoneura TaxID=428564 RepID=A0A8D8XZI8_9HEMI